MIEINACDTETYPAGIRVEAKPPNGNSCSDEVFMSLSTVGVPPSAPPTHAPSQTPRADCHVDVSLSCVLSNGQPCTSISTPDTGVCDIAPIESITLSYIGMGCDVLGNSQREEAQCFDQAQIGFDEPVSIECRSLSGDSLTVDPQSVQPGGALLVSSLNELPDKILCIIYDGEGSQLQSNQIDTSGKVRLDLGDTFGALRLDGCQRERESLSCLESLAYQVDLVNIGIVNMTTTRVSFLFNGQSFDLLEEIRQNPLMAGQSTTLVPSLEINVCDTNELLAEVSVQADPPSGSPCGDNEQLL